MLMDACGWGGVQQWECGRQGAACEVWCWVRVQVWLNCFVVLVGICLSAMTLAASIFVVARTLAMLPAKVSVVRLFCLAANSWIMLDGIATSFLTSRQGLTGEGVGACVQKAFVQLTYVRSVIALLQASPHQQGQD